MFYDANFLLLLYNKIIPGRLDPPEQTRTIDMIINSKFTTQFNRNVFAIQKNCQLVNR